MLVRCASTSKKDFGTMASVDMDLNTFVFNLIHLCCNYTDENYMQNAKNSQQDFSKTIEAVQRFESMIKNVLDLAQDNTILKQSFETLKHTNSVKEMDNDTNVILFLELEKKETKHMCVKKSNLIYFRAFFEVYFYQKCVTERYLRYTKQVTTETQPVFHHFAWSEWQSFSKYFSALIELVCNEKKISSSIR